jgi:hypothetical protein
MSEAEIDFDVLAEAYLRAIAHHDDKDWWAWQQVDRLTARLEDGFRIVTLLIEKADSDKTISVVAAGPLEDLLDIHSFRALDMIEQAAIGNRRLQRALSLVAVPFRHELFERWYSLNCKYGFSEAATDNGDEVIAGIMQRMRDFVAGKIHDGMYVYEIGKLLSKPLPSLDERTRSLLQQADLDCELVDGQELAVRVHQLLLQLESGG